MDIEPPRARTVLCIVSYLVTVELFCDVSERAFNDNKISGANGRRASFDLYAS